MSIRRLGVALVATLTGAACAVPAGIGVPVLVQAGPPMGRVPPPAAAPGPYYPPPAAAPPYAAGPGPGQVPAPPAACLDPGERDLPDRFDRATRIDANSTTVGCIYRDDADLFVVTAPPGVAGQVIRYRLRGQADMAPGLEIFDANRKRLANLSAGDHQELIGWACVAGGTQVFARVSQLHGASEAYSLTLQTAPLVDGTEPNDSAEHPTVLAPGRTVSGLMANPANNPAAIVDWYRFDVRHEGEIAIDIDMSEGIASNAVLYDAFTRKLQQQQMASVGERFLFKTSVRRGTYNLYLTSLHDVASAAEGEPPPALTRPYTVTFVR